MKVAASPAGAFQFVALMADLPVEIDEVRKVPPYEFAIQIPPETASRRYTVMALGVAGPRQAAKSAPVSIQVERPDSPKQLKAEPSTLNFQYVGDDARMSVYGSFADGSTVDLTDSSLLTCASNAPEVATVNSNAVVTAVGPGRSGITIRYRDKMVEVPVEVPDKKQPESHVR